MTMHEKVTVGPILIQGAMAEETDWLVAQLERPEKIALGGYSFWRGSSNGCGLVIARTEIGEVNAACSATLGILHFAPAAVLNQGLAGAHTEALHIGDIVVGASCTHINDWQSAIRGRGEGSAPFSWVGSKRQRVLPGDPTLTVLFSAASYGEGQLLPGRLGSGDLFSREHDRILWLRETCGHLCEDMESIAVYEVCHRLGVPCLGVRIISNNELTGEPYTPAVGERLQRFVLETISHKENTRTCQSRQW